MTPSSVLLFAAGFGTRMAPLTDSQPKPLVRVAGKPLLDHAIDQCDDLQMVVNVHYRADDIKNHVRSRDILVSDETDQILETGGGLKRALPLLNSNPAFTMNTDAVWLGPNPLKTLTNAWDHTGMEALLLLIPRPNAVGHTGKGDFDLSADGRITRGTDYIYSGVQIIRTDGLAQISETAFSMWSLWNGMLTRGVMFGAVYEGKWCDVGQPQSITLAEQMLGWS